MAPVNYVARVVIASAFHPPKSPLGVSQVTSHPRLQFREYLSALQTYGYLVPEAKYSAWREAFEKYVEGDPQTGREQHALLVFYRRCLRISAKLCNLQHASLSFCDS